jgi:hypothetical protein
MPRDAGAGLAVLAEPPEPTACGMVINKAATAGLAIAALVAVACGTDMIMATTAVAIDL